ncbi:MAG TPA: type II secretion system F family protein [Rhodopila sp.]|nr:type II secretion system F family protein [Rhodopila sp.]
MPAWRYGAVDRSGRPIQGSLEAPDEATVLRQLRRDGALPLSISPSRSGLAGSLGGVLSGSIGGTRGLTRQDVTDLTRELATMLAAGQDLDRALRFLVETTTRRRVGRLLNDVRDEIRDGSSLAVALGRRPDSFSRLYVGLVRAGEAGGSLPATLDRMADLMEQERRLATTVQSALIYPALLTVGAIGAVTLLLTQVLPQFVPLFEQNGAALPASTQFLINAGDAVSRYGLAGLASALTLGLLVRALLREQAIRLGFDRLKLRLPVIGGLAKEVMAARFARTLGTLLQNRVSLIPALAIVREVVGNAAGTRAIDDATASATGGAGLSGSLGASGLFPVRLVHLLRLGEETAQLGPMALRAATIHEEKVRVLTQRLTALLVPAITIIMGALIAGIVSSLLLAMLSLNDLAQ